MTLQHACQFDEVLIEEVDEGTILRAGMKVLIPCSCGETPLDSQEILEARTVEMQAALLGQQPFVPIYHWAPVARRKQIERYGLRPGMRPTTSSGAMGAPCICFADSPSWAWVLSGGMRWTPGGEWDLWQTWLEDLREPVVLPTPDRPSGIYEVRTEHRVFKRDLWRAGSRTASR